MNCNYMLYAIIGALIALIAYQSWLHDRQVKTIIAGIRAKDAGEFKRALQPPEKDNKEPKPEASAQQEVG